MDNLKFNWHADINASPAQQAGGSLVIAGELVNAEVCANNFALAEDELPKVAEQVKDINLRIDHSKSARDVIGGFSFGKFDPEKKRILFEAEVDDPVFQKLISKGRLKYISIGATADAYCSKCGLSTKPFKTCKCKGSHDIIRNVKLKEASIITEPAYTSSEFKPVSFVASITSALAESQVTEPSKEGDSGPTGLNKNMEEKREMSESKQEVQATTLKPAGADAIVVLGEKFEKLAAAVSKLEERFKKEEDEERKKKDEEERKKEEAFVSKMDAILTKLDEALKKDTSPGIPKDIPKTKLEEPEEEEEEEEKPKVKKEVKASVTKVESATEGKVEITADAIPDWFKEIKAYAEKHLMS